MEKETKSKELISAEAAEKEWKEFLDENDARSLIPNEDDDKETYNEKKIGFDRVVRAISRGLIIIKDGIITQNLRFPLTAKDDNGRVILDKLSFDQRWTPKDREEIYKGMNTEDQSNLLIIQRRFCAKLTGVDMVLLQKLDGRDYKITDQIIAVFFT